MYRLVRVDVIAPARRKGIEHTTGLAEVVEVALKVLNTDMDQHVDPLKFRQLPDDVERQSFEVVGVQEGKMESTPIHCRDDPVDGLIGRFFVADRSTAQRSDALVYGCRHRRIGVVEMDFGEGCTAGLGSLVGDQWTSIDDTAGSSNERSARSRKQFDIGCTSAPFGRRHVTGSHGTRDLDVTAYPRMFLGGPFADLRNNQAVRGIDLDRLLFCHVALPQWAFYQN